MYHYCEICGNRLEDPQGEVPISVLIIDDVPYFFCCEDHRYVYYKDHCVDAYISSNGSIDYEE